MTKVIVTGAGGFIGSWLSQQLVREGYEVLGIDSFTDYYARRVKEENLRQLSESCEFQLVEGDICRLDLCRLFDEADVIYHLAAQAGVRASWGGEFDTYINSNIRATQLILEAVRSMSTAKLVYASSSSVYGEAETYPTTENTPTNPRSPYGVTKLAGENLVSLYAHNFGLRTVSLRYHTVYGPRQRPDMAMHRLIRSALLGETFPVYAALDVIRDFTFVEDICRATQAAGDTELDPGEVLNLSGGQSVTLRDVVKLVEKLTDAKIAMNELGASAGDVRRTGGDTTKARSALDWVPETSLEVGLARQVSDVKQRIDAGVYQRNDL